MEKSIQLDLWVSKEEYERWLAVADKFYMNIYEYIRKCTDANSNLMIEEFNLKIKE